MGRSKMDKEVPGTRLRQGIMTESRSKSKLAVLLCFCVRSEI